MQLSEAIREGAKIRPQAFDEYFDDFDTELPEDAEPEICSCVLGAAFEAVAGGPFFDDPASPCTAAWLTATFPVLEVQGVVCPVETCEEDPGAYLFNVVTHLNDHHRWTREDIADFVERIEAQNASASRP